mgnify:FL=1
MQPGDKDLRFMHNCTVLNCQLDALRDCYYRQDCTATRHTMYVFSLIILVSKTTSHCDTTRDEYQHK